MSVDHDSAVESAHDEAHVNAAPKQNSKLRALLFLLPIVVFVIAFAFYLHGGRYVSTENAYVKSNIIAVSSDVSGRVVEVHVTDNQLVKKGAVLFRLDSESMQLDVMQTEAQKAVVRAEIESLRAEHREALVSADEANARVRFLRQEFERQKKLKSQGLGGGQEHDEALFELRAAQQRVVVLNERIQKTLISFNGDPDMPVEDHPLYLQARVANEMAQSQLAKTTVLAPANGVVSNLQLQSGEFLEAGNPAFTLIESARVWVEANLKETQLTHVKEGQKATLEVDAYPGVEWQAIVSSIAPATGAQFTLLPPQNATGNWVKVVQRVPVSLQVHSPENAPVLRAGMTVTVQIDTEHQREILSWLRNFRPTDASADSISEITDSDKKPVRVFEQKTLQKVAPAYPDLTLTGTAVAEINEQNPDVYTVELLRTNDIGSLGEVMSQLPLDNAVMVYRLQDKQNGDGEFGLATGLFDSRAQADELSAQLNSLHPESVAQIRNPVVYQVGDLQDLILTD